MAPTPNLHDLTGAAEIPPALLERTETDLSSFLEGAQPIVEAVRWQGDAALQRFAREFDKVQAKEMSLRATAEEFERAFKEIDPAVRRAIDYAIGNIRGFHEAQKPEEMWLKEVRPGAFAGDRIRAIDSVACYVPRGKGSFPSVVMSIAPGRIKTTFHVGLARPRHQDMFSTREFIDLQREVIRTIREETMKAQAA